jgi:hypothetical protein
MLKMNSNLRKTTFTFQTSIAFGISLKGNKTIQNWRKDDSIPKLPSSLQVRDELGVCEIEVKGIMSKRQSRFAKQINNW